MSQVSEIPDGKYKYKFFSENHDWCEGHMTVTECRVGDPIDVFGNTALEVAGIKLIGEKEYEITFSGGGTAPMYFIEFNEWCKREERKSAWYCGGLTGHC